MVSQQYTWISEILQLHYDNQKFYHKAIKSIKDNGKEPHDDAQRMSNLILPVSMLQPDEDHPVRWNLRLKEPTIAKKTKILRMQK